MNKPKAICPECGAECRHEETAIYSVPYIWCECGFFAACWDVEDKTLKYNIALDLGLKLEEKK